MRRVESAEDPAIVPYFTLRARKGYARAFGIDPSEDASILVAEGEKLVERVLESDLDVLSMFALPQYFERFERLIRQNDIADEYQFFGDDELMTQVVGYKMHQGVMAVARVPESAPLQQLSGTIVVLNRLANVENVGAIVRNCAAFGVRSLIVDSDSASPWARRAVKTSMGTVFGLDVHTSTDLTGTLHQLRERGYSVVGAALSDEAVDPARLERCPTALVIGSEGNGIDPAVLAGCDQQVCIPIAAGVDSLNAAAATAVLLYELRRPTILTEL